MEKVVELSNMIRSNFTPVVLVITTPEVDQICQRNHCPLVDALSRCSFFGQQAQVKTALDTVHTINGFQVRYVSLHDLEARCAPTQEVQALGRLEQVTTQHAVAKPYSEFVLRDQADVPRFVAGMPRDPCPWFSVYRWEYLRSLPVVEMECFEHPVACLLAVSSSQDRTNDLFVHLFDDRNPPGPFRSGLLDPTIPKFYVLVHENTSQHNAEAKYSQMKGTFEKSKCMLLRISGQQDAPAGPPTPQQQPVAPAREDQAAIESLSRDLIFKGVVPQMERAVGIMSENVETSKRGLKNALKGWFGVGKSKKPEGPKTPVSPLAPYLLDPTMQQHILYALGSVENMQKRLGDYLFMLQDYNEASNVYRNAMKDYLNDKAYKYYAASCEMAGLCSVLLDPMGRNGAEQSLDNAYTFYIKDNLNRFSVRSVLLLADILRLRMQNQDAIARLVRAAEREQDDKICCAMMQEQAAFCHLFSDPPQVRKFAFRLVLAGNGFHQARQTRHALRCYLAAYPLYEARGWSAVDEHVQLQLVRHALAHDDLVMSVQYLEKLLLERGVGGYKQASYLREYLFTTKLLCERRAAAAAAPGDLSGAPQGGPAGAAAAGGGDEVCLPVPLVSSGHNNAVSMILRDYPPKSPEQEIWKSMKHDLKYEGQKYHKFKRTGYKPRKMFLSPAGESVFVELEMVNPLEVPLQITDLTLRAHHTQSPDNFRGRCADGSAAFSTSPVELVLDAKETRKLVLPLVPLKEGVLTIIGLNYALAGAVRGYRDFVLPRRRLNVTKEHERGVFYEPNQELTVRITKPMPLLEIELSSFPSAMLEGQLEPITVHLRNNGTSALNNIKVKLSHPGVFSFGEPEAPAAGGEAVAVAADAIDVPPPPPPPARLLSKDPSIVHITVASMAPNSSIRLPLWLRAHEVGEHDFRLLFFYHPEVPDAEMKYRLQRVTLHTSIVPSVRILTSTALSYVSLNAYLLNFEVENTSSDESQQQQLGLDVRLQELSALSADWQLEPLSKGSARRGSSGGQQAFTRPPLEPSSSLSDLLGISDGPGGGGGSSGLSASLSIPTLLTTPTAAAPVLDMHSVGPQQRTSLFFRILPNAARPASRESLPSASRSQKPARPPVCTTHPLGPGPTTSDADALLQQPKALSMDSSACNEPLMAFASSAAAAEKRRLQLQATARVSHVSHGRRRMNRRNTISSGLAGQQQQQQAQAQQAAASAAAAAFSAGGTPAISAGELATGGTGGGGSSDLDLVLLWHTVLPRDFGGKPRGTVVYGMHSIIGLGFTAPAVENKAVDADSLLRFSIEAPRKVMHDFHRQSLCAVPVKFRVSNNSASLPLSFCLETMKPHEPMEATAGFLPAASSPPPPQLLPPSQQPPSSSSTAGGPAAASVAPAAADGGASPAGVGAASAVQRRSQYFWAGETKWHVADLEPGTQISLETTACFSRPGLYNLNRFHFVMRSDKGRADKKIYSTVVHAIAIEEAANEPSKRTSTLLSAGFGT